MAHVAINDTDALDQYTASAGQTIFPYTFWVEDEADLDVYVNGTLKTLNVDYTVSGEQAENGGNVTFVSGLSLNDKVTIVRTTAIDRASGFGEGGAASWRGESLNLEFDRVIAMMQERKRENDRTLRLAQFSTFAGTLTLSPEDATGGDIIRLKTDKSGFELVDAVDAGLNSTLTPTADYFIAGNSGGTAWETKTPAQALVSLGFTSTITELNYTDGVTSAIQTQLDGKQPLDADLTAIAALTTTAYGRSVLETDNAAGARTLIGSVIGTDVQAYSAVLQDLATNLTAPATELNYVGGVTSAIQTQLDGKQPLDADLTAIAALGSTGFAVRTASNTWSQRSIAVATGLSISNGDGVSGNPTLSVNFTAFTEDSSPTPSTYEIFGYTGAAYRKTHLDDAVNAWLAANPIPVDDIDATGTPDSTVFLRGDGAWAAPAGAGDVVGPASSVDNGVALFDGTTGTLLQDLGVGSNGQFLGTNGTIPSFQALPSATDSAGGVVELATTAEATTGTDTGRAVTPAGLTAAVRSAFNVNLVEVTADGNYAKPSNLIGAWVLVQGAGAGGGSADDDGSDTIAGAGGGAGGWTLKYYTAAELSASEACVIGAGGAGGSGTGNNNGTNGGNTTFKTLTGTGGTGGMGGMTSGSTVWKAVQGGAGGAGLGGDIFGVGGQGGHGGANASSGGWAASGTGGASFFGQGGIGEAGNFTTGNVVDGAGANGVVYGSGGAGAIDDDTTGSAGGDGADGVVHIWELLYA